MTACVEAAATAVRDPGAARPTGNNRARTAIGTTDDYEETCCLGMGAFGAVVKARHRATGQTVAIKRLAAGEFCSQMVT
jgi:cell division cycle 2-like protein